MIYVYTSTISKLLSILAESAICSVRSGPSMTFDVPKCQLYIVLSFGITHIIMYCTYVKYDSYLLQKVRVLDIH